MNRSWQRQRQVFRMQASEFVARVQALGVFTTILKGHGHEFQNDPARLAHSAPQRERIHGDAIQQRPRQSLVCRSFVALHAEDFPPILFTKRLYNRLSLTFAHIVHYNMLGFWNVFVEDLPGKIRFLEQTVA